MSEIIIGRNAVLEALKNNREIEKITLAKGAEGSVRQIAAKAKEKHVPLYYSDKSRMDKMASGGTHQGVIAVCQLLCQLVFAEHAAGGQIQMNDVLFENAQRIVLPGFAQFSVRSLHVRFLRLFVIMNEDAFAGYAGRLHCRTAFPQGRL